jgi:hypothetical protein
LRSQRVALAEANERLAQWSTEVVDLRLLRDELKLKVAAARAEAALARTEMQQRQVELGQVIGERDQSRSQAAEAVGRAEALRGQLAEATEQLAEASARAGTLAEGLAVAVGSAQSAQAMASQERARSEGMFRPLCDLDSASFFSPCLKNFVRLSTESVKALAQAVEQKEADRVAMSEAISDFCRAFDLDDVPSGSSPQSHMRALGGHVRSRLRGALHHGVRRAFVVLASHYDVDLERVNEGYCLPDEDEAALAEVQRLDTAAVGPSAVLASSFEVEILPPVSSSGAGPDLAEGGDDAEGGPANVWSCRNSLSAACVCFSHPLRPKHFYRYVIKLCFLSSRFDYQDLFVGSRIAYPSESYFSRKVMSEVSVSRRRRSPSARSTLPLTRTLTRLQDSVIDIVEKARKSFW